MEADITRSAEPARRELQTLVSDEFIRNEVRDAIAAAKKAQKGPIASLVASDNVRWIATTLAIPLAVYLWGHHETEMADKARTERQQQDQVRADHERGLQAARQNVGLVIQLLPDINKGEESQERRNALEVMKALEDQGELPPALRTAFSKSLKEISLKTDGRATTASGREQLEIAGKNAPTSSDIESGKATPSAIVVPGVKVYIQIFNDARLGDAQKVQAIARKLGIAAPGIENVTVTAAKRNRPPPGGYDVPVLLVFKQDDMKGANLLVDAVGKEAGIQLLVRDRSNIPAFKNVPAGQLEVWFESK